MKRDLIKLIAVAVVLFITGFLLKAVGLSELTAEASQDNTAAGQFVFTTPDGLELHYWLSDAAIKSKDGGNPPGLALLLPMLGHTHDSFDPFADSLNAHGYLTIALDLRGHGKSTKRGTEELHYSSMDTDDFARIPLDIAAFLQDFKRRNPRMADFDNVVAIGASIGANAAGLLLDEKVINRAVLLSPGRNYRGLEPGMVMVDEYSASPLQKPVYIAAATDDTYSAESSQWLFDNYQGPKVFKKYPGQDHGTSILHNVKDADRELLDWLIEPSKK